MKITHAIMFKNTPHKNTIHTRGFLNKKSTVIKFIQ